MNVTALEENEFNAFYSTYISKVNPEHNLVEALEYGYETYCLFYERIPEEKWTYTYDTGKWSILESLLHVIDTERIFTYRALRIGRGDKTPLSGFEQDDYILPSGANFRTMPSLLEEYRQVRLCTINLFKNMSTQALREIGTASNSALSARAAGFIICGHEIHHAHIIRTRYLE